MSEFTGMLQAAPRTERSAESVVFATLPELGMDTMTEHGVEFVLCPSALTAQM